MASHIKLSSPPKSPSSKPMSWFPIKPQAETKKKEKWGRLIFPQVSSVSPCVSEWRSWLCEFGMADVCLGFQPAPGTSVLCTQPIHIAHLQQSDKPRILMCCIFFSPGNPVRILQSGNNKICMIHQCSLNALAFAALHLTSCSLSMLARNSFGHGACPWVLNIWRMFWKA